MKHRNIYSYFLIYFIGVFFGLVTAQYALSAEQPDKAKNAPGQDEMMQKYKEYSTPNENHKLLDAFVGDWDYTVKWWMAPGTEPEVSTGTTSIKWIMGGRFLKEKAAGTSMGQPFEGMGIMGYDNEKKKYESVWIDNMGTGMAKDTGTYDPATKTIIQEGTFSCPTEGDKTYRSVTKIPVNNSFTYEWYKNDNDGKEFRAMEISYTRKK